MTNLVFIFNGFVSGEEMHSSLAAKSKEAKFSDLIQNLLTIPMKPILVVADSFLPFLGRACGMELLIGMESASSKK